MKSGNVYRDFVPSGAQVSPDTRAGRSYIAIIGIDRYRAWNRLYNAVSDAKGAQRLFAGLGFELVTPPLFDDGATGDALRRLVVDDLAGLGGDDSLVLFFAGHGHTMARTYGGVSVRDGYLIPADGDCPGGRTGTWIRLESWLTEITRIPAKHILVILDACHSGLALGPILQWRSRGMENPRREPLEQLRVRRSRRIITSALDDQLAMDGGPVPGHSLFTGCLIEAMTGGLVASAGHQIVTGSEIGHYVQRRVSEYPGSAQTPDFGALELDDRGELLVDIGRKSTDEVQPVAVTFEGAAPGNNLYAPGSVHRIGGAASKEEEPPGSDERPSPTGRRTRFLWLGSGIVMAVIGAAATLVALRDSASVEGMAVTPAPAGSIPDARQADAVDPAPASAPSAIDRKPPQQPSRRTGDASSSESTPPSIDIDDRGN